MDFKKLSPEQMKIAEMVIEAAEYYKLDPNLLLAQAYEESRFRHIPSTDPESDAFGVLQIRPSTAEQNKLGDIRDLRTNIYGGAKLMRQYFDEYKSPEAALLAYHQGPGVANSYVKSGGDLKSVGPKGLDYVINIGTNGGFGQPPAEEAAAEGEEPPKPPFVPVASTFPEATTDNTQTQKKPENVVSPTTGAIAGALASTVGQYPFTSELEIAKPPPDLDAAEKAANKAQRQFEIAQQRLDARVNNAMPIAGGTDLATLEAEYRRSQFMLQIAEKDLQEAVAAQKAKVAPAPAPAAPSAPAAGSLASATPSGPAIITDPNVPTADQHTRAIQGTTEDGVTGRARQTTYNERTSQIARNAANQQQVLQVLGQQGIVDPNKAMALTEGISGSTPSGIKVSPDLAGEAQNKAELEQKIVDDKAAQERLAQQNEMDRLKNERALAAQEHSQAQSAFNKAQTAKTSGVTRAQNTMETAEDRARLLAEELDEARKAGKNAPSTAGRVLQNTGAKIGKGSTIVKGGLGALGGYEAAKGINTLANLSLSDLQKRYDEGDRSPALMAAIAKAAEATAQVGVGTAAALPAFGPQTSKIKGAGVAGTAALGAMQLWNASREKARQRRDNQ
jgi:hypothetical protein